MRYGTLVVADICVHISTEVPHLLCVDNLMVHMLVCLCVCVTGNVVVFVVRPGQGIFYNEIETGLSICVFLFLVHIV